MHILNFEAFLLAITLLTLTPGIDTVLVIKNASRSGGRDGVVTSLGICLGLFVRTRRFQLWEYPLFYCNRQSSLWR